jgi:threonine/homoserine/homoserine lactone efflux protein
MTRLSKTFMKSVFLTHGLRHEGHFNVFQYSEVYISATGCLFLDRACLTVYSSQMMQYVGIFITSFIFAFSGALMPGPLLTVTINETLKRGLLTGPLMIVGHAILEMIFIVVILWGLGSILNNPIILSIFAFLGCVILLWMGVSMISELKTVTLPEGTDPPPRNALQRTLAHPVVSGFVVSLSNPYWIIWWLTIGLTYIFVSLKLGIVGVIVFFAGHFLADLLWYSIVSASVSYGKKFITDKLYRVVVGTCGVMLLGFSIYFFKSGFDYLLSR